FSLRHETVGDLFPVVGTGLGRQGGEELGDLPHGQPHALGEPGDLDPADGGVGEAALVACRAIRGDHAVLLVEAHGGGGHGAVARDLADRQDRPASRHRRWSAGVHESRRLHGSTVVTRGLDFNQCSTLSVVPTRESADGRPLRRRRTNQRMETMQQPILVTGATGNTGRHVVAELLTEGHAVRALTRDPARADLPSPVDLVAGDVTRPEDVAVAARGAAAAYLVWPRTDDGAEGAAEVAAALGEHVNRVVYLSATGADEGGVWG